MIQELNERSRQIFRTIVESYLETGEPVGSRTLSQRLDFSLSPASIRNVMSDLEQAGLLYSPHASAGRLPTQAGLRIFVDSFLELGSLTEDERRSIEAQGAAAGKSVEDLLTEATKQLSGLSQCAGLVIAPKADKPLSHVEFVNLGPGRALAVIVSEDGSVENRIVDVPAGLTPSALQVASNYMSARLGGRTFAEGHHRIRQEIEDQRAELDQLAAKVVEAGLATWSDEGERNMLIVSGRARLLDDLTALADLERVRQLFDDLESKRDVLQLLELAQDADGVRIFIGSENKLFSLSGSSLIVAPFRRRNEQIVGMIGVIAPTRVNYGRVVPMVDYTARVIGRLMS
ncbi:heat-inducible transcriptional repressor HrcA [Zavarzinia compransoris]|uniref:heat-inducible transcriptional repressor HrcA n=1 Tax=Zavarzinia marina TaxID=2911065 RepID=UPI001EEDBCAC|nr:heat-inducible transcriptional repressor HrcA [Zavarzinia marina]MCF4166870.1 heat-inducible transcriptional repressor HrcA [Zavarzinia marina]